MKVEKWLTRYPCQPATVKTGSDLEQAAKILLARPELRDVYVVDEQDRLCGHLSFRHIAGVLLAHLRPAHTRRQLLDRIATGQVEDHMNNSLPCIARHDRLSDVLHQYMELRIEDIPVIDEQRRLIGIVRLRDVLKHDLLE